MKRSDGPRVGSRGVGNRCLEILRNPVSGPVRRGRDTLQIRRYKLARNIANQAVTKMLLDGVNVLRVPDRVRRSAYGLRHPVIALCAGAHRPFRRTIYAHAGFPLLADFGKIVSPHVGGTAAVRAVHHGDFAIGQRSASVDRPNQGIVPFSYPAHVNSSQNLGRETQIVRHFREVIDRHHAAQYGGESQILRLSARKVFFGSDSHIGCGEVHLILR